MERCAEFQKGTEATLAGLLSAALLRPKSRIQGHFSGRSIRDTVQRTKRITMMRWRNQRCLT